MNTESLINKICSKEESIRTLCDQNKMSYADVTDLQDSIKEDMKELVRQALAEPYIHPAIFDKIGFMGTPYDFLSDDDIRDIATIIIHITGNEYNKLMYVTNFMSVLNPGCVLDCLNLYYYSIALKDTRTSSISDNNLTDITEPLVIINIGERSYGVSSAFNIGCSSIYTRYGCQQIERLCTHPSSMVYLYNLMDAQIETGRF